MVSSNEPAVSEGAPLVSICVPTWNGARYLAAALDSALAQTYAPIEILVSDDGSTDETTAILERYRAAHPDIVRVLTHPRLGMVRNWNHLVAEAKGEFIKYLFQDDLLRPACVASLVAATRGDPRVGLAFSRRSILFEAEAEANPIVAGSRHTSSDLHTAWTRLAPLQEGVALLADARLLSDPINKIGEPTTVLLRRDLFDAIGGFDESLKQVVDVEMWLRVMCHYKVAFVDEDLSVFRMHLRQATWQNVADRSIPDDIARFKAILASDPRFEPLRRTRVSAASPPLANPAAQSEAGMLAATPQGVWRQSLRRDAKELATLRAARRDVINLWLGPLSEAARQDAWTKGLGEAFRQLLTAGVQDEPLEPAEVDVVRALEGVLASSVKRLDDAVALLALMLYRRPHLYAEGFGVELAALPAWLVPGIVEMLLVPPQLFTAPGEAARYGGYLRRTVARLYDFVAPLMRNRRQATDAVAGTAILALTKDPSFVQGYFNDLNLRDAYAQRGQLLAWLLELIGAPTGHRFGPRPSNRKKLRLGVIAAHFKPSAETFALLPVFEHLDADFEVYLYTPDAEDHPLKTYCASRAAALRVLPSGADLLANLRRRAEIVRRDDLDLLFFGNNLTATVNHYTFLGCCRLARVQVTGAASVTTTGLPALDVYLSGALTDPSPDAPKHYTERLVRIEGSAHCFSYGDAHAEPRVRPSRADLGFAPDDVIVASAANFFKLLPEVVDAYAAVLERAPRARLLLFPYGPNWASRYAKHHFASMLHATLSARGLAPERAVLVDWPDLDRDDVRAFLSLADLYLDTFPFASTTSLVEPLEVGLPVVCCDGALFRSAMGAAMLRELGAPELVAATPDDFVDLAARLANDDDARTRMRGTVRARMAAGPRFLDSRRYGAAVSAAFREMASAGSK